MDKRSIDNYTNERLRLCAQSKRAVSSKVLSLHPYYERSFTGYVNCTFFAIPFRQYDPQAYNFIHAKIFPLFCLTNIYLSSYFALNAY